MAIVVFLVGIMSVIRMFPPGFLVVKHSENITLANRLAQAELERWKGVAANLPGGILPWGWDEAAGVYTVLPDTDPENLREPGPPLPSGFNPHYYTDVNKFRHIYAEATKIPVPSPVNWDYGSIYVLSFSPIALGLDDSVLVYSGPMRRAGWSTYAGWEDVPSPRSYHHYYINYDTGEIKLRPAPYRRQFVITYSYWDDSAGQPRLVPALNQPIEVPANVKVAEAPGPIGMGIERGSDSLHRGFVQLDPAGQWGADPYEFKILDLYAGVLGFNPNGYGYEEYTARGRVPLTAYIDYNVLDWHIIREDRKIPDPDHITSPTDLDVKLTLGFIKKRGETNEFDGTPYRGLAGSAPYGYLPYDVLAVDLETGEWYSEQSPEPSTDEPALQVNYKDGIVHFHPNFAGRTFRIYYRAEDDWAVQVFKAYDIYRRSYNRALDHRQYYYHKDNGRLYFKRCYAGSIVAVDYSYRVALSGGGYGDHTVAGDSFQISQATDLGGLCYIDMLARIADLQGVAKSDLAITRITKVYGVSVGARVIWREGGRGFQAGRWKKVDLQTYLTRAQD